MKPRLGAFSPNSGTLNCPLRPINGLRSPRSTPVSGFSLIEILVAISLSAALFSAAALVYQSVSSQANPLGTLSSVSFSEGTLDNLYGLDQTSINVYTAPNLARSSLAGRVAELLQDDTASASAVFILGRNGLNTYRPTTIPYPSGSATLDSPARFLAHIATQVPGSTSQFVTYEAVNSQDNHTIFLLQPSASASALNVLSVYDFDSIPISGTGTYVSVRRYVAGELTAYYDILYPASSGTAFRPNAIHFFRRGLASHIGSSDAKFAVAEEMPFYFVWWPDPATRTLESPSNPPAPSLPSGSPLLDYYHMGGRTQFHFTLPAFPCLQ